MTCSKIFVCCGISCSVSFECGEVSGSVSSYVAGCHAV